MNFYKSLQIDLDFLPDSYPDPDHFMCFMPRKFLHLLYSMIFELRFDSNLDSKSVYILAFLGLEIRSSKLAIHYVHRVITEARFTAIRQVQKSKWRLKVITDLISW